MIKSIALLAAGLWFFAAAPKAEAQMYQEFLLCENCASAGDFESVARNRVSRRGEWHYAVGNPNTGKFRYVTVSYTPPGEDPWLLPAEAKLPRSEEVVVVETPVRSSVVYAEQNTNRVMVRTANGGTSWATSQPATAAQNAEFQAIVHISRTRIIVNTPSNNNAFDSLAGYQQEQLSPYLWTAMTVNNPGWNSNVITSSLRSLLYKSVGWMQGKGPIACAVFNNGDFACFQLNPMDGNAAIYIEGTGKDLNGNPITRAPSLPNGSGVKTIIDHGPTGRSRFGLQDGGAWLSCATQGGKPLGCYVVYEAQ